MDYANKQELADRLDRLTKSFREESPNYPVISVAGCLNYQLGRKAKAEELLTKAYEEAGEDLKTRGVSASALGLIHLKNFQREKAKPFLKASQDYHLGRWMIVLYYIDFYRETQDPEHLQMAIQYMESKNTEEGGTSATTRFVEQMNRVLALGAQCPPPGEDGQPVLAPACKKADFKDEKQYLFSTAHGFLSKLMKEPPFNNESTL